jgi:hypothetical protein
MMICVRHIQQAYLDIPDSSNIHCNRTALARITSASDRAPLTLEHHDLVQSAAIQEFKGPRELRSPDFRNSVVGASANWQ